MDTAPTTIYTDTKIELVLQAIKNGISHITPGYVRLAMDKYNSSNAMISVLRHNLEKIQYSSWIGCEFKNGYFDGKAYRCEMHIDNEIVPMEFLV